MNCDIATAQTQKLSSHTEYTPARTHTHQTLNLCIIERERKKKRISEGISLC